MPKIQLPRVINQNPRLASQRLQEEYLAYVAKLKSIQRQSSELIEALKSRSKKQKNVQSNPS